MSNPNAGDLTLALDARLIGAGSTGDSVYWEGLLSGLASIPCDGLRLLLLSNVPAPAGVPMPPGAEWVVVPGRGRWWSLAAFPTAARRLGADLAHVQYSASPLLTRFVTTVHDVSFLIGPEWFRPRDRFLLSRSVPATMRRAAQVLTVSQTSAGEIERLAGIPRARITVTPNALNPRFRSLSPEEGAARRDRLGLTEPYVLTASTRWPRKNMILAIQTVEGLPARLPHRLALAGRSGWGREEPGVRTLRLGYLDFDDLSAAYQGAAAYLCPSLHEGFGLPLLEAFAAGCPALVSSGGALPEVAGGAAEVMADWAPESWSAR
ncbi:MAG: glycosyltransferase family 4 protein, partial [Fimbriimonadaceae bacterium]|nr:glycosyltransferase family 4 protein [Fimbriimonadaceae bacterium]